MNLLPSAVTPESPVLYGLLTASLTAVPAAFGGALLLVVVGLFRRVRVARLALFGFLTVPVAFVASLLVLLVAGQTSFQFWTIATFVLVLAWVGAALAFWLPPDVRVSGRH